jgi:hypothetical protein
MCKKNLQGKLIPGVIPCLNHHQSTDDWPGDLTRDRVCLSNRFSNNGPFPLQSWAM